MRKQIILLLAALMSVGVMAQTEPYQKTSFLGIPVDGTKEAMIQELQAKGLTYNEKDGLLYARIDGQWSSVDVVTNKNKVWRITVMNVDAYSEQEVRVRYNYLLNQLRNNADYKPYSRVDPIPDDESIAEKLAAQEGAYDSGFFQKASDGKFYKNKRIWFEIFCVKQWFFLCIYYDNPENG